MLPIRFHPVVEINDVDEALKMYQDFPRLIDRSGRTFLTVLLESKEDERSEQEVLEDVQKLVQAGTDVNAGEGAAEFLPLQLAYLRKFISIARFLLSNGANPNAKDRVGRNAVWVAAFAAGWMNDLSILTEILDAGGDATVVSKDGNTVLDQVLDAFNSLRTKKERQRWERIAKILRDHNAPTPETDFKQTDEYRRQQAEFRKMFAEMGFVSKRQ